MEHAAAQKLEVILAAQEAPRRRRQLIEIPVLHLFPDPTNHTDYDPEYLELLASSFPLIKPVKARRLPREEFARHFPQYAERFGIPEEVYVSPIANRRGLATRLGGYATIRVEPQEEEGPLEAYAQQLIENFQRSDFSPERKALAAAQLFEVHQHKRRMEGREVTPSEFASALGYAEGTLRQYLSFAHLPERWRRRTRTKEERDAAERRPRLAFQHAALIGRLSQTGADSAAVERAQEEVWEKILSGRLASAKGIREYVRHKELSLTGRPDPRNDTLFKQPLDLAPAQRQLTQRLAQVQQDLERIVAVQELPLLPLSAFTEARIPPGMRFDGLAAELLWHTERLDGRFGGYAPYARGRQPDQRSTEGYERILLWATEQWVRKQRRDGGAGAVPFWHDGVLRFPAYGNIEPDASNIRGRHTITSRSIRDLKESIASHGLLEPLLVRPLRTPSGKPRMRDKRPVYEIVAGDRRHTSIGELIEEGRWDNGVPAYVANLSDAEAKFVQLLEDTRKSPSVTKLRDVIKGAMQELGIAGDITREHAREFLERTGVYNADASLMERYMTYAELPDSVARLHHTYRLLTLNEVIALADAPAESQQRRLAAAILTPLPDRRKDLIYGRSLVGDTLPMFPDETERRWDKDLVPYIEARGKQLLLGLQASHAEISRAKRADLTSAQLRRLGAIASLSERLVDGVYGSLRVEAA